MSVARAVAVAFALHLIACTPRPGPPPRGVPAGSVAVLPLRVGGTLNDEGRFVPGPDPEAGPGEHGVLAARLFTERLAALGVPVIDPERVAGAAARAGAYDARRAARIVARLGADFAALGALSRYREREGSALGVRTPASVAYQILIVRAADGSPVAIDRFDYTQQPLSENLLDLPMFLRGKGRWMTRDELLTAALGESAEKIAAALRAVPRADRPR
jgi:hypothetical protein